MQTLLWVLVAGFFTGYFVLEGLDFGVGMMLARGTKAERNRLARSISPLFLGNEVWLVAAVGLVIGAFPALETTQGPRLYPLIVIILLAWMVRDAGLWFRGRTTGDWWDRAIALASLVLPFSWGFLLTDVAEGGPAIARPLPIVGGIVAVAVVFLHGRFFATANRYAAVTSAVIAMAVLAVLLANRPADAAGSATLDLLAAFVLPALPLLLGVQVWLWRVSRRSTGLPGFF
ncbi:MAG TPA: cytochrome d ubiquinol oxidase subunit II [Mycobacteriales bacterium]|nr:cytochrome d ubiquinol oxidase subunit II [Mycobacteriales bacterium]